MRNNRPGSIQAAVREVYTACGGLEAVGDDIKVSVATLSNGTDIERPAGLGVNYLDTICRMNKAGAAIMARHFATLAGGVFQPVELCEMDACIVKHSQRLVLENGQASAAVYGALSTDCDDLLAIADAEVGDVVDAGVALRAAIRKKRGRKR